MKDLNSPSRWNFRIWDVEKKEWLCESDPEALTYYGFDIRGGEVVIDQGLAEVYNRSSHGAEFIWEQSTGRRDINGKEIYEGDILECEGDLAEVIWRSEQAEFGIRWLDAGVEDSLAWYLLLYPKEVKVVGNIHEKSELAKEEKWNQ